MTDEWLSLSDAAKLLGVHPSTVRLWSDKGVLPTHRTSGGHRRYRRDEVLLWSDTAREVRAEPEGIMHMAMKNVRVQIGEANLESESWYQKLDENARKQYRESARSLAQGLMTYLASETEDDDAHAIGYEYDLPRPAGPQGYLRFHGRNEKGWLVNAYDARYDYLYNTPELI